MRTDQISGNSGVVYEITDLTVEDRGTYTCRAVSNGGKIISRNANLDVNGKYLQNWDRPMSLSPSLPSKLGGSVNGSIYLMDSP